MSKNEFIEEKVKSYRLAFKDSSWHSDNWNRIEPLIRLSFSQGYDKGYEDGFNDWGTEVEEVEELEELVQST